MSVASPISMAASSEARATTADHGAPAAGTSSPIRPDCLIGMTEAEAAKAIIPGTFFAHPELTALKIGTGPFDDVVTQSLGFCISDGWTKRSESDGLLCEDRPSPFSDKRALRVTARIPNTNSGSLEALLCDDPYFADTKDLYCYQYDSLLEKRSGLEYVSDAIVVVHTLYKSPVWGVAPRDMVNYIHPGVLLNKQQQEMLGVRPKSAPQAEAAGKELWVFAQCGINCDRFPETSGYQRGCTARVVMMAQEEADDSITFTVCFAIDPCGQLPAALADFANNEQVKKTRAMVDLMKKIGPHQHLANVYVNHPGFRPLKARMNEIDSLARRKAAQ